MLNLVWSKDKSVKEEVLKILIQIQVINTYWNIFMNSLEFKDKKIAENLIDLLNDTNITEATSFEELLASILD